MAERKKLFQRAEAQHKQSVDRAIADPTARNARRALINILLANAAQKGVDTLSQSSAEFLADKTLERMAKGVSIGDVVQMADTNGGDFVSAIGTALGGQPAHINQVKGIRSQHKICGFAPYC